MKCTLPTQLILLALIGCTFSMSLKAQPLVIAHRGASGYLPEHTLAAKALAHAMGADYIEQDVVLTADGVPIVLHDIYLESTTDVEQVFPDRARADGRYYAIDFSLAEIKQLSAHERTNREAGNQRRAVYPDRYPLQVPFLPVPTLEEEILLIAGLDASRERRTGLYIELKAPNFHLREGQDMAAAILSVLERTGYAALSEQVFLQCFDDATLRSLKSKTDLPLIQLIAENDWGEDSNVDYDALRSDSGLDDIATYADGIGPWIMQLYLGRDDNGKARTTDLVERAHARGLVVHPYTIRQDQLPSGIDTIDALHNILFVQLKVDGAFTDFPDLTRQFIDQPPAQQ